MPRYIDAEKLCELARNHINRTVDCNDIMRFPLADVVEVVRCKDCIHRDPEDKKCDCSFQAKGGIFPMDDDNFCSYGERRKEDVNA